MGQDVGIRPQGSNSNGRAAVDAVREAIRARTVFVVEAELQRAETYLERWRAVFLDVVYMSGVDFCRKYKDQPWGLSPYNNHREHAELGYRSARREVESLTEELHGRR